MKQIIKILDCESGKELEIVNGKYCHKCFFEDEEKDCPRTKNNNYICDCGTIFKEAIKEETK
jgi:hypothetical protein